MYLPGLCAEIQGGVGGKLNVSHHSHHYRHIMFGNRGDVGTEFLPRIYSRRDKFPIIDFLHFSVTHKEIALHVLVATCASSWDARALAFGGQRKRRKDRE